MSDLGDSLLGKPLHGHVAEAGRDAHLAGLLHAESIARARQGMLETERARLALKRGASSDAVKRIDAKLAAHAIVVAGLSSDIERAQIEPPELDDEHAVVHGRVVEGRGAGLRGYTVTVHDAERAKLGGADTGAGGYFLIRIPVGKSVVAGAARAEAVKIRLRVAEGQTQHPIPHPDMEAAAGAAVYRELVITDPKGKKPV